LFIKYRYTSKKDTVFAFVLKNGNGKVVLSSPRTNLFTSVELLGYKGKVSWSKLPDQGMEIDMSSLDVSDMLTWTFKLKYIL